MSLKLYLFRHGETVYSRGGGFCGDLDPELTPEGLAMAAAFTQTYRQVPWTAIYASPMKRTIATAQPLCDALGLDLQLREGLKEIRYGQWEEQTSELVQQQYADDYAAWMTEPAWNAPTGGETAVQIASRAMSVMAEIEAQHAEGHVLVVSHKATIRIMLCSLLGIDLGRYRDRLNVLAASLSVIKYGKYGPMLETLGDRYHLPEHLRNLPGT
jgi:broad specificity phosphatase PhoE